MGWWGVLLVLFLTTQAVFGDDCTDALVAHQVRLGRHREASLLAEQSSARSPGSGVWFSSKLSNCRPKFPKLPDDFGTHPFRKDEIPKPKKVNVESAAKLAKPLPKFHITKSQLAKIRKLAKKAANSAGKKERKVALRGKAQKHKKKKKHGKKGKKKKKGGKKGRRKKGVAAQRKALYKGFKAIIHFMEGTKHKSVFEFGYKKVKNSKRNPGGFRNEYKIFPRAYRKFSKGLKKLAKRSKRRKKGKKKKSKKKKSKKKKKKKKKKKGKKKKGKKKPLTLYIMGQSSPGGTEKDNKGLKLERAKSVACYVATYLHRKQGLKEFVLKLGAAKKHGGTKAANERNVQIFFGKNKKLKKNFRFDHKWVQGKRLHKGHGDGGLSKACFGKAGKASVKWKTKHFHDWWLDYLKKK